jgi:integration host factor subunit beta
MRTFIKKDVVERVASRSQERPDTVAKVVNDTFTVLREIMSGNEPELRIEIRDFGVFEVKKTKPKPKARNPKTNEIIYVAARRKTHFKPGKLLKESLKTPLDQINSSSS